MIPYAHSVRTDDPELAPLLAGQGTGLGSATRAAGTGVEEIVQDATRIPRDRSGSRREA